MFGYGVVPYLAGSTSVQLSSQADIDDQRPTDAWRCFAMGYCGLPSSSQRESALDIRRRWLLVLRNGIGNRG
ncbi:MAG: hypothetical protein WA323_08100, partial [Candidatus Nitrosopolaris sp.]